jgi:hypothetical protein
MASKHNTDHEDSERDAKRHRSRPSASDGTIESLRAELEHIEKHRGPSVNIQKSCDIAASWKHRGQTALGDGTISEFSLELLKELVTACGPTLEFPEIGESGAWPPALRAARAVWECCTGAHQKNESGNAERYIVPLAEMAWSVARERDDAVQDMTSVGNMLSAKG